MSFKQMAELSLDLPEECSRRQEEESTRQLVQSEITRLHQAYARQIDTLESIIQDKDVQLYQYQQTVSQQTCELANLREELAFLRSRDLRLDPERSALLTALCDVKLDELFCRLKPSIVQVNLSIAKLVSIQQDPGLDMSFASAVEEEEVPESARSFLETAKQDSSRLQETAFQLSRREMNKEEERCGKCEKLKAKVEVLCSEIRKHKAFIETLKKALETMVGSKSRV
jgi:hypothetical protein